MSDELKPCPFCGEEPRVSDLLVYPNGEKYPANVKCRRCGIVKANYDSVEKAVTVWNTRPGEDALRAEIERLQAQNKDLLEALECLLDTVDKSMHGVEGLHTWQCGAPDHGRCSCDAYERVS